MKQIPHDWTPERVAALKTLFNEGVSFSHIASQLALTRNAVLGKCNRLGLRRDSPPDLSRTRAAAAKAGHLNHKFRRPRSDSTKNKTYNKLVTGPKFSPEPLPSPMESDLAIPRRRRKNIWTLGPRDCRFPIGTPGEASFFFCGSKKVEGLPYCALHAKRCFYPARRA